MHRKSKEIYEIETNSGLKIKATKDHPFLTDNAMTPVFDLEKNENLAVNLFEGIEDRKIIDKKQAITAKILGYMFGDGCLYESKERIYGVIYGQEEDLKTMKNDLEDIGVSSKIYSRNRNHKIQRKLQ